MNWFIRALQKDATRRRFAPNDMVRYFTDPRKGTGKGVVLTPMFSRGRVVDYDTNMRQYRVWSDRDNAEIMVHPRNIVPESIDRIRSQPSEVEDQQSVEPFQQTQQTMMAQV